MGNKYYKIIFSPIHLTPIGTIVNTDEKIDFRKIRRFAELKPLMKLIYDCSEKFNLPIQFIISFLEANFFLRKKVKIDKDLKLALYQIKKESRNSHFKLKKEFRFFLDYVLDKLRNDDLNNSDLPDRFKVNYFFESVDDCKKYIQDLNMNLCYIKIMEVEFIDIISIDKFDNYYTSNLERCATARSFYCQALLYLLKSESNDPLCEVLFKGTYLVSNYISAL